MEREYYVIQYGQMYYMADFTKTRRKDQGKKFTSATRAEKWAATNQLTGRAVKLNAAVDRWANLRDMQKIYNMSPTPGWLHCPTPIIFSANN